MAHMHLPHYRGRFAPSPTGPLHAGSLVAALASWLDARAHNGTWLVRIEDIDHPRCPAGADRLILSQLAQCGLHSDEPVVWQSQRHNHYAHALEQLQTALLAYPCGCTRKDIEAALEQQGMPHERHIERPYPGTCRNGLHGKTARSWRFALDAYLAHLTETQNPPFSNADYSLTNGVLTWRDRRLGTQQQAPAQVAGDFVLKRADGLYAYQLAVVVDDALQSITHVVRGEDLADNTARQLLLQHALGLPHPIYMHTPLVRMPDGEKLSKQHGAPALELHQPIQALNTAASCLHLTKLSPETPVPDALSQWVKQWQATYNERRD